MCKFDDNSLYLYDWFIDDLVTYIPPEEKIESRCHDICIVNKPLFLDELFKDK